MRLRVIVALTAFVVVRLNDRSCRRRDRLGYRGGYGLGTHGWSDSDWDSQVSLRAELEVLASYVLARQQNR
jgi:hypothetical protein